MESALKINALARSLIDNISMVLYTAGLGKEIKDYESFGLSNLLISAAFIKLNKLILFCDLEYVGKYSCR